MKEFTYVIRDAEGLHARPAGLLVKLAQGFSLYDSAIRQWEERRRQASVCRNEAGG